MYKKAFTLVTAILFTAVSFAQSSAFDKFEDYDEVSAVVVNSEMFRMMGKVGGDTPEAKEYAEMISGLKELKVFTTEDSGIAAKMKSSFDKYLKNNTLTQLMRVKDKDANVKIYVKKGATEDIVKELVMFVDGIKNKSDKEAVLLSLTGTIDLDKISEIAAQMNLPGGDHLKKGK